MATATATRKPSGRTTARKSSAKSKADAPKRDSYADITNQILELLDQGTVIWHQPWKSIADGLPTSLSTGKIYRGINIFILEFEAMVKGYSSNLWGTYRQIQERRGQVRKGEKGTTIVFWKRIPIKVQENGEDKVKQIPFLRAYTVFNIEQCDWAEDARLPKVAERTQVDPIEAAEALIADYMKLGPSLSHGGDRAFYRAAVDAIRLPHQADFVNAEEYYSTLYHEVTHSTGHSRRLARDGIADGTFGAFGDPVYSKEELVAEMGAAMLSALAGIEQHTIEASAAYLAHWRDALKGDNKLIVQAAAQAQRAVDLVLGTKFDDEGEEG